ncbi:MAG TPA: hypothetical protein VMF59_03670 [Bacteroidota bacterium]|nr:hypothetical protein [Bacteroidota bacterium]
MRRLPVCAALLALGAASASAQSADSASPYPASFGLSIGGNLGSYSVRDEFISHEKYSGTLPGLIVEWSDVGASGGNRFTFEYESAPAIKNHNVSTSILEFAMGIDWIYPVGEFSLFSKPVFASLGPSSEFYIHFRSQNLSTGGPAIFRTYSFASLFSVGASASFVCPVSAEFIADASIGTSLAGLGGRLVNPDDSQKSMFEFLTLVAGLRCKTDVGLRYMMLSNLSVRLGYRLEIVRIDAWDYFISGSDIAALSVRYGF